MDKNYTLSSNRQHTWLHKSIHYSYGSRTTSSPPTGSTHMIPQIHSLLMQIKNNTLSSCWQHTHDSIHPFITDADQEQHPLLLAAHTWFHRSIHYWRKSRTTPSPPAGSTHTIPQIHSLLTQIKSYTLSSCWQHTHDSKDPFITDADQEQLPLLLLAAQTWFHRSIHYWCRSRTTPSPPAGSTHMIP